MYLVNLTQPEYNYLKDTALACLFVSTRGIRDVLQVTIELPDISLVQFQTWHKIALFTAISKASGVNPSHIAKVALPRFSLGTVAIYAIGTNDTATVRQNMANIDLSGFGAADMYVGDTKLVLQNSDPPPNYSKIGVIVGTVIGFLMLLKVLFAIWYVLHVRRKKSGDLPVSEHETVYEPPLPWYKTPPPSIDRSQPSLTQEDRPIQTREQFWQQFRKS